MQEAQRLGRLVENPIMPAFTRTRFTWFAYVFWMFFGFYVNVLGPLTPFLKDELKLSYTVSSLHFSAFAVGMLGAGLLLIGRSPVITIGAAFVMGLLGSLIIALLPSAFADQYGAQSAVAPSEANVLASAMGALAPLWVGWSAQTWGGWRLPVGLMALLPLGIYARFRAVTFPSEKAPRPPRATTPLPAAFWWYWAALFIAVSIEFCMLPWSADYLEHTYALRKTDAAQALSLFLGGMIAGRWAGGRLAQRFAARPLVLASLVLAACGFGLFWRSGLTGVALGGLFLTGLGVASLFPLLMSLALQTTPNTVQASARATLASGGAVLLLPLILGRLADSMGIQLAYGMVAVLIVGALGIVLWAGRMERPNAPAIR
jgi:fucose permease